MVSTASAKLLETPDIQARLKKIKLLILDVDGVMTDGKVFWLEGHGWTRTFHVKDGYGLKVLMKCGIQVAVISGGDSKDVRTRMEFLKIPYIFLGDEDKIKALDKIVEATKLPLESMAFIGDELFDIPVMERVEQDGLPPDFATRLPTLQLSRFAELKPGTRPRSPVKPACGSTRRRRGMRERS